MRVGVGKVGEKLLNLTVNEQEKLHHQRRRRHHGQSNHTGTKEGMYYQHLPVRKKGANVL